MSTKRKERKNNDIAEIEGLIARTKEPILELPSTRFSDLPISSKTMEGLTKANFVEMTEIQKKALPIALCRKDILAAAKTGSGKTLAFLIPLLETLYINKWGAQDGLGALVISPTRELAVQIFDVLRKIGQFHSFSAGLVIGGKDFKIEKTRIQKMNILVGTPGRLLQHMDETSSFDAQNLQMLVLDEADRILDMGFSKAVNAIVDFLPQYRQTLLFSATQTKSVRDLSRLSLQNPEYVGAHEKADFSTPESLTQHYMVIDLPKKLDTLYSFVKTHLKTKAIVFMSSCKQVRFVFETFRKLQPGVPLLHLHGKQKQSKRVEVFDKFKSMSEAYLFCTDIAARGLDFPAINWVIQLDCPEDAETYIHRVGRTARYEAQGSALLFLLPSEEEAMVKLLENFKIPVAKIAPNKSHLQSIQSLLQSFCFKDPEVKYLGQKAFISYVKSIYLQKNKSVFDVSKLPAEAFAASLGLPGTPQIKFLKKAERKLKDLAALSIAEAAEPQELFKVKPKTKVEKLFAKKNRTVLAEHYAKMVDHDDSNSENANSKDEEDFMTIKRKDHDLEGETAIGLNKEEAIALTKRQNQKLKQKAIKNAPKGEKLVFDEDGIAHSMYELEDGSAFVDTVDVKAVQKEHFDSEQRKLAQEDVVDKGVAMDKKKAKLLKKKAHASEANEGVQVTLSVSDISQESSYSSGTDSESDISDSLVKKRGQPEHSSTNLVKRARVIETDQPDTLEDQEALALKLLGGDF